MSDSWSTSSSALYEVLLYVTRLGTGSLIFINVMRTDTEWILHTAGAVSSQEGHGFKSPLEFYFTTPAIMHRMFV